MGRNCRDSASKPHCVLVSRAYLMRNWSSNSILCNEKHDSDNSSVEFSQTRKDAMVIR